MFERIVSNANDVIMVAEISPGERRYLITYVNEAFVRTFGYRQDEMLGRSPRMLNGPETDPQTIAEVSQAIHAGANIRRRILNYTKAGEAIWMEVNIVPLADADGNYTHFASIERDVTVQVQRERELSHLARTDPLTRLMNRRAFGGALNYEIEHSERTGRPLSLSTFDLDHFKRVNDTYGHQAGDFVLETFANLLKQSMRPEDSVARTGGEEFSWLMSAAEVTEAAAQVQRFQERLRSATVALPCGSQLNVTCSAGVTALAPFVDSAVSLAQRADHAMYEAKRRGRDRAVIAAVNGSERNAA